VDVQRIECETVEGIDPARDREKWTVVNTATKFTVFVKCKNFLTVLEFVSFSRRPLFLVIGQLFSQLCRYCSHAWCLVFEVLRSYLLLRFCSDA
jgi:hypothetical protein